MILATITPPYNITLASDFPPPELAFNSLVEELRSEAWSAPEVFAKSPMSEQFVITLSHPKEAGRSSGLVDYLFLCP